MIVVSKAARVFLLVYCLILSGVKAQNEGSIRIDGNGSTGRVEVYYNGQWGTVCDDGWDITDAHVVCRQLGFSKALQAYSDARHGQGTGPIWLDEMACLGWEPHLYDCRHNGWGRHDCTHSEDASVQCSYGYASIRLVGGGATYGRVEICENGQWGTICDDQWDLNDANVACRQLGFSGASFAPCCAAYGQGSGPILRDHIRCQGWETSLLKCPTTQYSPGYCNHGEDSGVVCY